MPVTICTPRQKVRMPPKVYQMFRFRGVGKVVHRVVHQPRQRQTLIEPAARNRTWECRSMDRTSVCSSTDLDAGVGQEGVGRHRQILRRRSFADAARRCRIASHGSGRASRHNRLAELRRGNVGVQPRWVQTPIRISHSGLMARLASVAGALSGRLALRARGSGRSDDGHRLGLGDFLGRAAAHEQRMAAPLERRPAGPAGSGERSTSIEASASAAVDGFIWSMKGQAAAATPTAPIAPDAT